MLAGAAALLDCDVLIVGLGPVGATLAALLGQGGISVIVIEAENEIYPLPRAAHVDHEIMRVFQRVGVAKAIMPHVRPAPDYEFRTASGELLIRVEREGLSGVSGWPISLNVYQPGIERALRSRLAELPSVRVICGSRFSKLIANDENHVRVQTYADGVETQYSSRFIVGCDGARSDVREACGGDLEDYGFDEPWLVLDAKIADESGFPPMNIQYCDPSRPTSFVHMGPGRLRWEFMLKPGEQADQMKSDGAIASLLAPWRKCGIFEIERRAVYRFHGLIATKWRNGRVFIAGDSAHQMPPFMGQGLCSGLRDAANLAWKLRVAVSGRAAGALLDTYQTEREPHVAFVVKKAIEMGRIVCTLDPDAAAARNAKMLAAPVSAPPVVFPPLANGCFLQNTPGAGSIFPQPVEADIAGAPLYLDDRLGEHAWLLHLGKPPPRKTASDVTVVSVDDLGGASAHAVRAWLAVHASEAVLVRPDRNVFGSGDADELMEAYRDWIN